MLQNVYPPAPPPPDYPKSPDGLLWRWLVFNVNIFQPSSAKLYSHREKAKATWLWTNCIDSYQGIQTKWKRKQKQRNCLIPYEPIGVKAKVKIACECNIKLCHIVSMVTMSIAQWMDPSPIHLARLGSILGLTLYAPYYGSTDSTPQDLNPPPPPVDHLVPPLRTTSPDPPNRMTDWTESTTLPYVVDNRGQHYHDRRQGQRGSGRRIACKLMNLIQV